MIKRYYNIIIALVLALLVAPNMTGQTNSLYFLQNIPESNDLNPSLKPNCKWYIGIPGINSVYIQEHNDITYSDVLYKKLNTDSLFHPLNNSGYFDEFRKKLEESSLFNVDVNETLLRFGFKINNGYFHFSNSIKTSVNYTLPKDVAWVINGMAEAEAVDFSPLGINTISYHEFSFGYSHDIKHNLTVGAKIKLLRGIFGVTSDIKKASIYSTTKYWKTKLDGTVNMSAPVEVTDEDPNDNKIDDIEFYDDDDQRIEDALFGKNNPGFAVDLGAEYILNEKWHFSASLIDLGRIKWNSNLNNIHYETDQRLEALDLDVEEWNDIEDAADDFLDEIEDELYSSTTQNSFKSNLPAKLYFGAAYELTPNIGFGILSNTRFYDERTTESIMFSTNLNAYKWITSSLSYNLNFDGPETLGFTLGLNAGAVQFYLATDYLYYRYDPVVTDGETFNVPKDFSDLRVQFGFNLLFGRRKASDAAQVNSIYNQRIPGNVRY